MQILRAVKANDKLHLICQNKSMKYETAEKKAVRTNPNGFHKHVSGKNAKSFKFVLDTSCQFCHFFSSSLCLLGIRWAQLCIYNI